MSKGEPKIALVHDELIRRGGAEVVFEELTRIFPQADVFALYAGKPILEFERQRRVVQTSFLQRWPRWFRRHPGRMLPWLLLAAEQFDFSQYDLVLSSVSGFAKAIVTRANVPHICYCHTPTRYLWDSTHEILQQRSRFVRPPLAALFHMLRMLDYAAAQRVDMWLANSKYTQARIKKYYRKDSEVVYPPIRTDFYFPEQKQRSYFLIVGRASPTKHFEQAILVCKKLALPLEMVGIGGGRYVSDEKLRELYRRARAVLIPGVEDFGMAAAEALACGTPVIAQHAGGVTEIVKNFQHGILYDGQGVEALAEGIRRFLAHEATFMPEALHRHIEQFSVKIFHKAIQNAVVRTAGNRNT